MNIFVPTSLDMLPEYLSSGFIGLPASKDYEGDIQSKCYPSVVGYEHGCDILNDVFIKINISEDRKFLSQDNFYQFEGPISISRIDEIIFHDQEQLDNFKNSFGFLPDLNLDYFKLSVSDKNSDCQIQIITSKNIKYKKRKMRNNLSQFSSIIIGLIESFSYNSSLISPPNQIDIKKFTNRSFIKDNIINILNEHEDINSTPDYLFDFIDLYLKSIDSIGFDNEIDPSYLLRTLKESINEEEDNEVTFINFLSQIERVQNGLVQPPTFDVYDSRVVLSRAILIAFLASNLDSARKLHKGNKFSGKVGRIACLLIAARFALPRINKECLEDSKVGYLSFLSVIEHCISSNAFSLRVDLSPAEKDFSSIQKVLINDKVMREEVVTDTNITEVVARLRNSQFNPLAGSPGVIYIKEDEDNSSDHVNISFKEVLATSASNLNLQISTTIENSSHIFSKKNKREKLLSVCDKYMVASFITKNDCICIARYQLLTTMDKDELRHHIELIRLAMIEIRTLL